MVRLCLLVSVASLVSFLTVATESYSVVSRRSISTSCEMSSAPPDSVKSSHPFCDLPGDPSVMITTNIDLGDKKMEIMKSLSKSVAEHTGKPESYVAISITDNASVIFAGSDAPTALGVVYSIGAVAMESNGALTNALTDLLTPFDVHPGRIYVNFFDMPRANVGWSRRTFAG